MTQKPVSGYSEQPDSKVDLVNNNKELEENLLRVCDDLRTLPFVDQRWLAIGVTHLEQAFMALNRSIFKPQRIKLPGDPE